MTDAETESRRPRARTLALYLTIAVLAASAVLGAVLIVVGDQANLAGRAWMTLLLVGAFAGAVVFDATVSNGPNRWYLAASTITNAVLVAIGLLKLWNGPLQPADTGDEVVWAVQIWRFMAVVALARAALLLTQLYGLHFVTRAGSRVSSLGGTATLALAWATAVVLSLPAIFPEPEWPDWWWRLAGATTLVAAVAAVIPLIVRAFEAKPVARVERADGADGAAHPQPRYQPPQPPHHQQPGSQPPPAGAQPQPNIAPPAADTLPQPASGFTPPQ